MSTVARIIAFTYANVINGLQRIFVHSQGLYKILFLPGMERIRWQTGVWRAWKNFDRTYRRVPAYKAYIEERGGYPRVPVRRLTPDLSVIPEIDKESYVKQYPNAARCVGGKIPLKGVMIDESSGSSGRPTSWVRGLEERYISKQMLQIAYHTILGGERALVINAFALGAWATGLNISMSLSDITVMKSTGPDLDKILNTIEEFGPEFNYIIMGYPPFLKTLADDPRIQWDKYSVSAAYGGEGMSEAMRTYLGKTFAAVFGSYGASDLEINIAAENEFTVAVRQLILADERVREELIWTDLGVTPMVFQFNPMAYFIETNAERELVITLTRATNVSPKIRYNIHDMGHVMRWPEFRRTIQRLGLEGVFAGVERRTDLPLLFHYGRSDMSIDYFGANVTPDSIREILYGIEELAPVFETFKLLAYEDEDNNKRMAIAVELSRGAENRFDAAAIGKQVFERLAKVNKDFHNAYYHTATEDMHPEFTIHESGTGPFVGGQRKLKHAYVETDITYDDL